VILQPSSGERSRNENVQQEWTVPKIIVYQLITILLLLVESDELNEMTRAMLKLLMNRAHSSFYLIHFTSVSAQ